MLILAVDTSTSCGSVAVLDGEQVRGVVSTNAEETYSSRLFRHLDILLRELDVKLEQVELYAVVAGPGSFTGLRVGLTAVKGWAEVYGRPVAAVSGLEAVAAQARAGAEWLAAVTDARRGQIYGGLYQRTADGLVRHGDEVVMTAGEFLRELAAQTPGAKLTFVTPAPQVLAAAAPSSPFRDAPIERVSAVLAPVVGQLGWARAQRNDLVDALALDANYIRRSDAELLWRENSRR